MLLKAQDIKPFKHTLTDHNRVLVVEARQRNGRTLLSCESGLSVIYSIDMLVSVGLVDGGPPHGHRVRLAA